MKSKFRALSHTADIKFLIFGSSLDEIFENSVLAFSSYISSDKKINKKINKKIELKAENKESLLYKFLDELIYLLDAENFAVLKARVKIKDNKLIAQLFGDHTKNYSLKHIKAATYAEMYIKKTGKNWKAQIVLDV